MMNPVMKIYPAQTSFDKLPTEILLDIFDYLTCNDIIYTFFFFTPRLNSLLFHHEHYLNTFELPISNLKFWQNTLTMIGLRVKTLHISTIDLSLSLDLFTNLRSIIISAPYGLPDRSLQSLFESQQFQKLHSLKIKSENYLRPRGSLFRDNFEHYLFAKLFNAEHVLEVFEYLSLTAVFSRNTMNKFEINPYLCSLTLYLSEFIDIFAVLQYTPNLIYLNVKTTVSCVHKKQEEWINLNRIKLEKLYLTFITKSSLRTEDFISRIDFLHLLSDIKLFSSTLLCLSMNFIDLNINSIDEFPLNGLKLQHQLLESMIELKQFHLYSRIKQHEFDIDRILKTFEDQFWMDHQWSVGMHGNYLYTLPFHFDELNGFIDFDHIQSNNDDILNDPGIWHNVKSIELVRSNKFDLDLIKQLKIKIPKLVSIKFISSGLYSYSELTKEPYVNKDATLTSVTTVHFIGGSIENIKQWLIFILPNLKHLILSYTGLPSPNSQLIPILDNKIQRLDIYEHSVIEQMCQTNDIYFSNVQDIRLTLYNIEGKFQWYVDILKKILGSYHNLKTLSVYITDGNDIQTFGSSEAELSKIIEYLKINESMKNYDVKRHREHALFSKYRS